MLSCDNLDNSKVFKGSKFSADFVIQNDKGLHTRPSTELVKCACKFRSNILLTYNDTEVNAKSILGILMLAAAKGSNLKVEASGSDAKAAVDAILKLAKNKFNISY